MYVTDSNDRADRPLFRYKFTVINEQLYSPLAEVKIQYNTIQ